MATNLPSIKNPLMLSHPSTSLTYGSVMGYKAAERYFASARSVVMTSRRRGNDVFTKSSQIFLKL